MKRLTLLLTIGLCILSACRKSVEPGGPMALSPVPQDVQVSPTVPPPPTLIQPTFTFTPSAIPPTSVTWCATTCTPLPTTSPTFPPSTPTFFATVTPLPTLTITPSATPSPIPPTPVVTASLTPTRPRPTRTPPYTPSALPPVQLSQLYASKSFGIAFDYPEGWYVQSEADNLIVLVSYNADLPTPQFPKTVQDGESRISFALMQGLFNGPTTLDEYMTQARTDGLLVDERDWGSMGGIPEKRLTFDILPEADKVQLSYMYMLETDGHLIQITLDGDAIQVLDSIATSIRALNP